MKIKVVSDLHLEFPGAVMDFPETDQDKEITLVLAGDIAVGEGVKPYLDKWSKQFKHVVYIAGNHEYYGKVYELVNDALYSLAEDYDNVYFLNRDFIELDGVQFFGDTFWTPGGDEWENKIAKQMMNDFRMIKRIHGLTGDFVNIDHVSYLYWFRDTIEAYNKWIDNGFQGKRVVISHHAPSSRSIHPNFYGNDLNAFYKFDANKYLKSLDNVSLWLHGHIHSNSDYWLTDTRVVANPKGYIGQENPEFNPNIVLDV